MINLIQQYTDAKTLFFLLAACAASIAPTLPMLPNREVKNVRVEKVVNFEKRMNDKDCEIEQLKSDILRGYK